MPAARIIPSLLCLCSLCVAIAGCGSTPPADLSAATFPAVAHTPIAAPRLSVTVALDAVTQRAYRSGSPDYGLAYAMGDADVKYAQAVARAAFAGADFDVAPARGNAELRLTSFTHVLVPHSTGTLPDVTDEVTAKWALYDRGGELVAQFVFVGVQTGSTHGGFMGAQIERGQARAVLALQDLYRKTLEGFAAARAIKEVIER